MKATCCGRYSTVAINVRLMRRKTIESGQENQQKEMDKGDRDTGESHTEYKLLNRRKHIHSEGHLQLVDLQLQPLAEVLERRHAGRKWW
jgi:hypothetical protein